MKILPIYWCIRCGLLTKPSRKIWNNVTFWRLYIKEKVHFFYKPTGSNSLIQNLDKGRGKKWGGIFWCQIQIWHLLRGKGNSKASWYILGEFCDKLMQGFHLHGKYVESSSEVIVGFFLYTNVWGKLFAKLKNLFSQSQQ